MGRNLGQKSKNREEKAEMGIVGVGRIGREFYRTLPFPPAFRSAQSLRLNMEQQQLFKPQARLFSNLDDSPERDIQGAILRYLEKCSKVAWCHRMSVGRAKLSNPNGSARWVNFGFVGCPDIMGQLTDGRFLAVEVKSKRGKPSKEQADFIQTVQAAHGVGVVAYSVDDVIQALEKPLY